MLSMEWVLECIFSLGLPAGLREVKVLDIMVASCIAVMKEGAGEHTSSEAGSGVATGAYGLIRHCISSPCHHAHARLIRVEITVNIPDLMSKYACGRLIRSRHIASN